MEEDRLSKLELITNRLSRRTNKVSSALITPYPISNAVIGDKIEGDVLRYMFPCDGVITKGAIDLGVRPKDSIVITVELASELSKTSKSFTLDKRRLTISPEIEVSTFDRLTVSVSPNTVITEFWISLLWVPKVKDVVVKSFLIDELEVSKDDILQG